MLIYLLQSIQRMSSTHISLRSFTNNTDLTQSTLVEVYGNERSTIYHIINDPFLPIIKTSDVTVTSINSSPWHMEIQFKNKKDISNIKKIESFILSILIIQCVSNNTLIWIIET